MLRLYFGLLATFAFMNACTAPQARGRAQAVEFVAAPHRSAGSDLVAELRAMAPSAPMGSTTVRARSAAWAELRLRVSGDRLEYRFSLANPGGNRYGTAQLYSGTDTTSGEVVATLFSDAGLSSRREDLRGTATFAPSVDHLVTAERLRSRADTFFVVLHPTGAGVALLGRIR